MNTQTRPNSSFTKQGLLLVLLSVLVLSSCSSTDQAHRSYCPAYLEMRTTIDVTDAAPRVVFDQLADELNCEVSVSPFIWKHVTLHVEDMKVLDVLEETCMQIGCEYIFDQSTLTIKPLTVIGRIKARNREIINREIEMRIKILQSPLPEGMIFIDAHLSRVLEEISEASGLKLKPWEDEGDRMVTLDVSGMTVNEALVAVLRYIDGEGPVLIKTCSVFQCIYSQLWPWGYPP